MAAKRIPTEIGDVLILQTTESYTAVGRVSERGQQDFVHAEARLPGANGPVG